MSKYAERFAENENDFSILPELTDQDLEKTLGYRRKILRAIARLDGAAQVERRLWPCYDAAATKSSGGGSRAGWRLRLLSSTPCVPRSTFDSHWRRRRHPSLAIITGDQCAREV